MKPLLPYLLLPSLLFSAKPSVEEIEKQLAQRILTADQSLKEVQAFCETRVPDMPDIKNPQEWLKESNRIRREVLDKIVFRGKQACGKVIGYSLAPMHAIPTRM